MKLTKKDFVNAGYSKADAARLANDSNSNWKAAKGGKRKRVYFSQNPLFAGSAKYANSVKH